MRVLDLDILRRILEAHDGFGHREHLELAWEYLGRYDAEAAYEAVAAAIRHLAEMHGAPDKYHETITRSWVHLVAVHRAGSDHTSFDDFIAHHRPLLDRQLLARHYSRELIASPEARTKWVEPDLAELPAGR
jgi:hypothetical protein